MEDPHVPPRSIMSRLEVFLPFALESYVDHPELFENRPGYEPGLRESNLAVILAHIAVSDDYSEPGNEPHLSRGRLIELACAALAEIARHPWDGLQPLAWSYVSYALVLLGDRVEQRVREVLRDGVRRWADRLLEYDFPTGLYRDTKAEETCWTVGTLVGAQVLWPGDQHVPRWREKAHFFYLNSYNREEDLWEGAVIEGRPVRERVSTANVFSDFSTENHGAFHPVYQVCFDNYSIPYVLSKSSLGRVPDSLVWNWEGLHSVMQRLFTSEGEIAYPAGNDYYPDSHAHQAHYLALVADALKDPLALWALKKALARVARFQELNGGRLVGDALGAGGDVYWELHFASFLVFAHALAPFDGIRVIDDEEALEIGRGPWVSPYSNLLVYKGSKLHVCSSLRGLARKQPGCGFVAPRGSQRWTDYFCAVPLLTAEIRDHDGQVVGLDLGERILGASDEEAWSVAAYGDPEGRLRRTCCLLAGEGGALHVERIMRYGEQVPIFGSDRNLSRVAAAETEYGPWGVRTLHYRMTNDKTSFRPLVLRDSAGERTLDREGQSWKSEGAWIILDERLALLRLWGTGNWVLEYGEELEPLHGGHYWNHRTWALRVGLEGAEPPPRGYGLMGGHAVLFLPIGDPRAVETVLDEGRAKVEEKHGEFTFSCNVDGWNTTRRIGLDHLLSFE